MKKLLLLLFFSLVPLLLTAQQHPLPVESASLLDPGNIQIDFGVAHFRDQPYPLSGLTGNLWKLGNLRFRISLSDYVELQTDGTLLNLLTVTQRQSAFDSAVATPNNFTGDIGDFTLWTKFLILNEYRFGVGLSIRFGVQLPNASNESGLGVDEMNFYSSFLLQKHFIGMWTANFGVGILGDPTQVGNQHDVFLYGFEYNVPIRESTFCLLQAAGRTGHAGSGIPHLAGGKIGIEQDSNNFIARIFAVINYSGEDKAKGIELTIAYSFHAIDTK
ncbi:MAG: hypothetical protein PHP42_00840 [Bacteroidota bacterium]|nr:hypothetical protein [Bacteroidota bacterium]